MLIDSLNTNYLANLDYSMWNDFLSFENSALASDLISSSSIHT